MFNKNQNNFNQRNRFKGNQFNALNNDSYDELIYGVLQQFNLEMLNKPNTEKNLHTKLENMTAEDFIDEMFIALRTIYNATISIDNQSNIKVKFSDNCHFKIQIAACRLRHSSEGKKTRIMPATAILKHAIIVRCF